jgi:hypothetical protein
MAPPSRGLQSQSQLSSGSFLSLSFVPAILGRFHLQKHSNRPALAASLAAENYLGNGVTGSPDAQLVYFPFILILNQALRMIRK